MIKNAAICSIAAILSFNWNAASANVLCDFTSKRPKNATIGGKIVRGPWTIDYDGELKYGMEIGDAAGAKCGPFPSTVIVLTNKSINGCSLGSTVVATGRGQSGLAPPGFPIYKMIAQKLECR